jgi:hypothetical protein
MEEERRETRREIWSVAFSTQSFRLLQYKRHEALISISIYLL